MQENKSSPGTWYIFQPSDSELLGFFLYNKIRNGLLPSDEYIIPECNLYGSQEPWEIWNLFDGPYRDKRDEDLYFFTHLKKKSAKGSRISRKVGSGTWQGEDGATEIVDDNSNRRIGSKKRFRYENKESNEHGGWIMHEYTLDSSLLHPDQHNDYVLCRIRKNQQFLKKKKRQRKFEEADCEAQSDSTDIDNTLFSEPLKKNKKQRKFEEADSEPQSASTVVNNTFFLETPEYDHMRKFEEAHSEAQSASTAVNNALFLEPPEYDDRRKFEEADSEAQSAPTAYWNNTFVLEPPECDDMSLMTDDDDSLVIRQYMCEYEHSPTLSSIFDIW